MIEFNKLGIVLMTTKELENMKLDIDIRKDEASIQQKTSDELNYRLMDIKRKEELRIENNKKDIKPVDSYKMWKACQDGFNKYRKCRAYVHELTPEQIEYYQSLNTENDSNLIGLLEKYFSLPFKYLKEPNDTWESPTELIAIRKKKGFLHNDCDGRALDMYYFLVANNCPDKFYLQVVDTIVEKHMNLLVWNKKLGDWVTIETTIWATSYGRMLNNPARYQNYSTPVLAFNGETEYLVRW